MRVLKGSALFFFVETSMSVPCSLGGCNKKKPVKLCIASHGLICVRPRRLGEGVLGDGCHFQHHQQGSSRSERGAICCERYSSAKASPNKNHIPATVTRRTIGHRRQSLPTIVKGKCGTLAEIEARCAMWPET